MPSIIIASGLIDLGPTGLWRIPLSAAQIDFAVRVGSEFLAKTTDRFPVKLYDDRATDIGSPEHGSRPPLAPLSITTPFLGIANHCAKNAQEGRSPDMGVVQEVATVGFAEHGMLYRVDTPISRPGVLRVVRATDWHALLAKSGATPANPGMAKAGYLIAPESYKTTFGGQDKSGNVHSNYYGASWPRDPCEEVYVFWATKKGWFSGLYTWAKLNFSDYH